MLNVKRVIPELEVFTPQTNGEISCSIVQNWTPQAIECYKINNDCSKCSINKSSYSFICQMPKIIEGLTKMYGKPKFNDF